MTVIIFLETPHSRIHSGESDSKKMKKLNSKSSYQLINLLYELLLFFISSFILFPLHVKRIVLCLVYSDDYQPSFIYPSLEEYLQPACIVEVESVFLPQIIYKNDSVSKFFLNLISCVTLKKPKLIQNLCRAQHSLP